MVPLLSTEKLTPYLRKILEILAPSCFEKHKHTQKDLIFFPYKTQSRTQENLAQPMCSNTLLIKNYNNKFVHCIVSQLESKSNKPK